MNTMGSVLHCPCWEDEDDDGQQSRQRRSRQRYDPPRQAMMSGRGGFRGGSRVTPYDDSMGSIQGIEASGVARLPQNSTDGEQGEEQENAGRLASQMVTCGTVGPQPEASGLVWFWQRVTQQSRMYDVLATEENSSIGTPPAPSMTKRPSFDKQKVPQSPLRAAVSFDCETHSIPSISQDEIVLPGSALQQQMAAKMCETLEEQGDECVICLEGFSETNPRMPTHCGCGDDKTFFHLPCLYQWTEQNSSCPTCRQPLHWDEF